MSNEYVQPVLEKRKVSIADRIHFRLMSLVHEDLYRLFRDPYEVLKAAGVEPGQTVLEVGCGPGFFTVPAAKIVGEQGSVCALDINPLAIEKAEQKVNTSGAANVETLLADASQTGLPDQSFDLIFVFGFANPVGSMNDILTELHRLLKPGGILAVEGRRGQPQVAGARFSLLERQGRISRFKKI